jgi:hypothetical protein
MSMKTVLSAIVLAAAALPMMAQASVLPSGVQNDVSSGTVAGWGFTECFSSAYGSYGPNISTVLAGCSGDYLMMAARRTGSSQFEVLAAADRADVTWNTGTGNVTHAANGVEWYFDPSYSWGFAGAGDTVSRNSCDVGGMGERDRLCWHTYGDEMAGGWRAGNYLWLNADNSWEKVLLVGNAGAPVNVPEPASLAILGLGLAGLAVSRRKAAR